MFWQPPPVEPIGRGRGRDLVKPAWMTDPSLMEKAATTAATAATTTTTSPTVTATQVLTNQQQQQHSATSTTTAAIAAAATTAHIAGSSTNGGDSAKVDITTAATAPPLLTTTTEKQGGAATNTASSGRPTSTASTAAPGGVSTTTTTTGCPSSSPAAANESNSRQRGRFGSRTSSTELGGAERSGARTTSRGSHHGRVDSRSRVRRRSPSSSVGRRDRTRRDPGDQKDRARRYRSQSSSRPRRDSEGDVRRSEGRRRRSCSSRSDRGERRRRNGDRRQGGRRSPMPSSQKRTRSPRADSGSVGGYGRRDSSPQPKKQRRLGPVRQSPPRSNCIESSAAAGSTDGATSPPRTGRSASPPRMDSRTTSRRPLARTDGTRRGSHQSSVDHHPGGSRCGSGSPRRPATRSVAHSSRRRSGSGGGYEGRYRGGDCGDRRRYRSPSPHNDSGHRRDRDRGRGHVRRRGDDYYNRNEWRRSRSPRGAVPRDASKPSQSRHSDICPPPTADLIRPPTNSTATMLSERLLTLRMSDTRTSAIAEAFGLFCEREFRGEDHRGSPLRVTDYLAMVFDSFPSKPEIKCRIALDISPTHSFCVDFESQRPFSTLSMFECINGLLTRVYLFRDDKNLCDSVSDITVQEFWRESQNGVDIIRHLKKKGMSSFDELRVTNKPQREATTDCLAAATTVSADNPPQPDKATAAATDESKAAAEQGEDSASAAAAAEENHQISETTAAESSPEASHSSDGKSAEAPAPLADADGEGEAPSSSLPESDQATGATTQCIPKDGDEEKTSAEEPLQGAASGHADSAEK